MFRSELAIAYFLLTTPPGVPENPPDAVRWPIVQSAVQQLAIEWELLDPRETRYILAKPDEFGVDINLLRRRFQELKDVPLLADARRLPDRATANDYIHFNRAFRKTLESRRAIETDRSDEWLAVIGETDKLYQVWDAVRDARCEFYYVTVRRHAMKKLRDHLGEEDWANGTMPPGVPTWRFAED